MAHKTVAVLLAIGLTMVACSENKVEKKAEAMLEKAKMELQECQYDKALHTIDSMRKACPEAIYARKEGLKLYQEVALAQAQSDLARTDSMLQAAKRDYEKMRSEVEAAKRELRATPDQLQSVTLKKMRTDSLQVRFDVQCAKIKYIHKKQRE